MEAFIEDLNGNSIALMQAGKVSKLALKHSFRVLQFDELGLMWLQFQRMSHAIMLHLHVSHQGNSGRGTRLREFQHREHPIRDVAQSLLSDEL